MVGGQRHDINLKDEVLGGIINFIDIPYYLVGILNFFVNIANLTGINAEVAIQGGDSPEAIKKRLAEEKKYQSEKERIRKVVNDKANKILKKTK